MKAIAILIFLLLPLPVKAATWYVRSDGNDANTGTSDTSGGAFRSIAAGLNAAQAGDTVLVGAGDYYTGFSNITTVRNGTSVAPIVVQGAGVTTITRAWNFYHDYIQVRDLKTQGGWYFYTASNNCLVEDCTSDLQVTTVGGNIWMQDNADHSQCHSHTIRNCQILNAKTASSQAVQLNGTGHLIEGCYLTKTDNGPDAFWIWGYNHIVRNNVIDQWHQVPYNAAIHMDLFQSFGNNNDPSQNILIEGNYFNGGTNTQFGNFTDDKKNETISDWTFRNNIFANVTNCQVMIYAPRFKFYNNLFYKCFTMSGKYASPTFRTSTDRGSGHEGVLINNIWYLCGQNTATSYHGFYDLMEDNGPLNGMVIDYNMVIGTGAGTAKNGKWTSYRSIARNVNGLNGIDPLFVNPINADTLDELRFEPESPAIGAAQVLNELFTTDYAGVTRGAAWDMGALEYDVGELPTDTTPPTLTTAIIDSTGTVLTLTFSENVTSVTAAHYSISTGNTLGGVAEVGPIITMTISPPVISGEVVTLGYTSGAGRTADAAGNLLATFSSIPVVNNSLEVTPDLPRATGRGSSTRRIRN